LQLPKPRQLNQNNQINQLPQKDHEIKHKESLEEQAMKMLIHEANQDANQLANGPILATNSIPGIHLMNEDDKFKLDVNLRPKDTSLEDYDDVPVDQFGAALLRGMGWKDGDSVGRNKNSLSRPIEFIARPEFLGLGAAPAEAPATHKKWIRKPGESKPNEYKPVELEDGRKRHYREIGGAARHLQSGIKRGMKVRVSHGRLEGKSGKVTEIQFREGKDPHVHVELNGSVHVFYEDELAKIVEEEDLVSRAFKNWLVPNIRVRVISKSLQDGTLFKQKVVIIDVTMPGICIIQTRDGKIVEGTFIGGKRG
jgi:G patch domain/KOW motif-containing protein